MAAKAKIRTGKKGGKYRNHKVKTGRNKGKVVKVYLSKAEKRKKKR